MIILLDNGHGRETPGKRSPNWGDIPQIFEWRYTRDRVKEIHSCLGIVGIESIVLVSEERDVPILERAKRANIVTNAVGSKNALLVSVHLNAANNAAARGWEIHTYLGNSISDTYARIFWEEAKKAIDGNTRMRGDWSDGDPDWDSNFGILRETACPAVLTENCFMTNKEDCRYLLSDAGKEAIVRLHVEAIRRIVNMR